jgi:hypothetical protein
MNPTLTKSQLLMNAKAMEALAHGQPIQYWSEGRKMWLDCRDCDTEFAHRPKPLDEEKKKISTDINDY